MGIFPELFDGYKLEKIRNIYLKLSEIPDKKCTIRDHTNLETNVTKKSKAISKKNKNTEQKNPKTVESSSLATEIDEQVPVFKTGYDYKGCKCKKNCRGTCGCKKRKIPCRSVCACSCPTKNK